MDYLTTRGLVLRTTEYKETDRILTVLSADHGLLTMKARGVRSNRSKLKGACQLLTYAEFTVGEAHGFSSITEATAIEMLPELSGCCVCGDPEPDRFSIADGTLECASCRASDGVRMPLSAASLAAMRYIVSCPDKKLFSFALTGAAEKELCDAAESYLLTQLERSFYTLDFYKSLLTE